MSDNQPPKAGTGARLMINSPLHQDSLGRLIQRATEHAPRRIVDHGCGWGEVLLQSVAASPGATGLGDDVHEPDLVRARAAAVERRLADRVTFVAGPATDHREPADLLISLGAFHAFGDPGEAMRALREDLRPGGRAMFGIEHWAETPTAEELSRMWPDASVDDCATLPDIVDELHAAQWRILDLHDSTRTEFDAYETGHLREREEWLAAQPDAVRREHPVRAELDQAWTSWLRGHRRSMGFVTFVLA